MRKVKKREGGGWHCFKTAAGSRAAGSNPGASLGHTVGRGTVMGHTYNTLTLTIGDELKIKKRHQEI